MAREVEKHQVRLTKRAVDAAEPRAVRYTLWDSTLGGFGLRVEASGTKTFILRYRPRGRGNSAPKRFVTIGRYGPVTPDQARQTVLELLGRVAKGEDPAADRQVASEETIGALVPRFLSEHVAKKRKPTTLSAYESAFRHHILPHLAQKHPSEVTRTDVARLHGALSEKPAVANYAVAALSSFYTWAASRGVVAEDFNPTRRLEKYREEKRERFLTGEELGRLGAALRLAESKGLPWTVDEGKPSSKHAPKPENRMTVISPFAIAAIRLLLLTGCRLREILHLRWNEVDLERGMLFLPDSKTGRRAVLLACPALDLIRSIPRHGPYVIAGATPNRPLSDLKRPWAAIRRHAGLDGLRIHDLRHSFASVGVGAGVGLPIVGKLLGHTQASTTARYAHLADDPVRQASELIAQAIADKLGW